MSNLDRDKLTNEEICLIAPCGIYCGACDMMLGRSRSHAQEMYRILEGFNFADVGPFFMGTEQEKVKEFLDVLERWSQGDKCPGCLGGGGNPACPIQICSSEKGFLTCAECGDMPCKRSAENKNWFQDAAAFLELITRRYANWNIENLERIKKIGYRRFNDEMQEKVKGGLITSDVIAGEMVFTEALKNM
ncbi:MAG: DUF3795 domain-containing protein [Dehalococcoidia bacterium]|nr:MAG: DUF3795 domain-containing protein [Dehalococcoidia bacterium]